MPSVGALQVQPAPLAAPRAVPRPRRVVAAGPASAARVVLGVESIGHLVRRTGYVGRVHSVFAQACNLVCEGRLLTIAAPGLGDGPATLRLAGARPADLRTLFDVGERIDCRHGIARTCRAELRLLGARVWRAADVGPSLAPARVEANLRRAQRGVAQRRAIVPSVIDGVSGALGDACRALDDAQAARHVERLVGWGEGLTPAGDDCLVGVLAGLDAGVAGHEARRRFRAALAAAIVACTPRTTEIAAHYLRLAGAGHYNAPLIDLRAALLCEDDDDVIDAALAAALAVGATSGADAVTGLLAALSAWLPRGCAMAAA